MSDPVNKYQYILNKHLRISIWLSQKNNRPEINTKSALICYSGNKLKFFFIINGNLQGDSLELIILGGYTCLFFIFEILLLYL